MINTGTLSGRILVTLRGVAGDEGGGDEWKGGQLGELATGLTMLALFLFWDKISPAVADKMFYVYPDYGNLVSASVPAGMALAEQQGLLNRGDTVACWVGSAGMAFSLNCFTY